MATSKIYGGTIRDEVIDMVGDPNAGVSRSEYERICALVGITPIPDRYCDRATWCTVWDSQGLAPLLMAALSSRRAVGIENETTPAAAQSIPGAAPPRRCRKCGGDQPQTTLAGSGICDDCEVRA